MCVYLKKRANAIRSEDSTMPHKCHMIVGGIHQWRSVTGSNTRDCKVYCVKAWDEVKQFLLELGRLMRWQRENIIGL